MNLLQVDVVTVEGRIYAGEASAVVAPSIEGQVTILPRHAALLAALMPGELRLIRPEQEDLILVVGGGFMEVLGDRVSVLADSAERADEIDVERARRARERAQEQMQQQKLDAVDFAKAEAALRRSMARLKTAERVRTTGGRQNSGQPK